LAGFSKLATSNKKAGSKKDFWQRPIFLAGAHHGGDGHENRSGALNQLFEMDEIKNQMRVLQTVTKISANSKNRFFGDVIF
jgi:hypothetical protein